MSCESFSNTLFPLASMMYQKKIIRRGRKLNIFFSMSSSMKINDIKDALASNDFLSDLVIFRVITNGKAAECAYGWDYNL